MRKNRSTSMLDALTFPRAFEIIRSSRVFAWTAGFLFVLAVGCSDTAVEIVDSGGGAPAPIDTTLPNGFVSENRPPLPSLSAEVPCPLGTVPGGADNPNVTLGCYFVDCIMAIDTPEFVPVAEAGLVDFERIVAVEVDGQVRGIPIRILIYHEVVNMCWTLSDGSKKYTMMSYCPIVEVTAHFLPTDYSCEGPSQKLVGYGVSSGLYNGDLIVYRRGTEGTVDGSYVQIYGGGLNDKCLEIERVNIDMPAGMFAQLYPEATVLTENTGMVPPAGAYDMFDHPYAEWWLSHGLCVNGLCFPLSKIDTRLPSKVYVYGVYTPTGQKAYPINHFKQQVLHDNVGGNDIVLFHERGATVAYETTVGGRQLNFSLVGWERHRLPLYEDEETGSMWTFDGIAVRGPLEGTRLTMLLGYRAFWFAWSAFFPETDLHEFD